MKLDACRIVAGFIVLLAALTLGCVLLIQFGPADLRPSVRLLRGVLDPAMWAAPILGLALPVLRRRTGAGTQVCADRFTRALAWHLALIFIAFEVGKAAHDAEMRQFFMASGYSIAMMYAVMLTEIAAALLLMGKRSWPVGGVLICVVMIGAITTHARNGDPWTDSLDAIRSLILGALLVDSAWARMQRRKGFARAK